MAFFDTEHTVLNISAATVIKSGSGHIFLVSVITAGSTAGGVYDNDKTDGHGVADQVYCIPNVLGMYHVDFPCHKGIVIAPGAGQVVAVAFN